MIDKKTLDVSGLSKDNMQGNSGLNYLMRLPDDLSQMTKIYEEVFDNKNLSSTMGPSLLPLLSTLGKVIEMAKILSFDIRDLCISDLKLNDEVEEDLNNRSAQNLNIKHELSNEQLISDGEEHCKKDSLAIKQQVIVDSQDTKVEQRYQYTLENCKEESVKNE